MEKISKKQLKQYLENKHEELIELYDIVKEFYSIETALNNIDEANDYNEALQIYSDDSGEELDLESEAGEE